MTPVKRPKPRRPLAIVRELTTVVNRTKPLAGCFAAGLYTERAKTLIADLRRSLSQERRRG